MQIAQTGLQVFKGKLYRVGEALSDDPIGTSVLGTPVYDDVTFPAGQYINLFGDVIAYDEVKLESVLVSADRPKNVIRTAVQGRDGTIKEYIAAGDYVINISGVIVGEKGTFPELEVERFTSLMDASASLPVVSSFLNDAIGVGDVVVDRHSIKQIRGFRDTVQINIICYSDVAIDIEELLIE